MKKFIIFISLFFCGYIYSQTPQNFTYQSVVRGPDGTLLFSKDLGFKLSILQTSINGSVVYSETHWATTNQNGLVTLIIGDGTTIDSFSAIDWSTGTYFLKVEVDPHGGSNYLIEDTSQLLSVPYALHSGSSNASLLLFGEDYLSYSGNELTLKKVDLSTNVSGTLPLTSGGTGATSAPMVGVITAADASAARTVLGVENSAAVTLATVTDNYLTITGQEVTAGTVPISLGGTGATSAPMIGVITAADAAAARTALGVDAAGTDGSTAVSLATVTDNYLTLDGQEVTAGTVPISLGGTGATSAPMVGVITAADGAAARTAIGAGSIATQNNDAVDIDGGAIDGTTIGAATKTTGAFTIVSSAIYESNGDTDVTLKTGNANTGNITIANGADGNIHISPNGTGKVVIDNLTFPAADGSANQILKTDASGNLSWISVDASGTDNSTAVTLATVTGNYLTITGQEVTAGTVPVSLGGTGGTDAAAARTALGVGTLAVQNVGAVDIGGGAIDATAIGATTASTGAFTTLAVSEGVTYGGDLSIVSGDPTRLYIESSGDNGNDVFLSLKSSDTEWLLKTNRGDQLNEGSGNQGDFFIREETQGVNAFVLETDSGNASFVSDLKLGGNLSLDGDNKELRFHEGANYVGFEAPALTADQVWVLPIEDGSTGQVIKTDGDGTLSFTTISSGSGSMEDADSDTKIQVEESADEDIIRFDIGGTEQVVLIDGQLKPTTTNDIDLGTASLEFKNAYFDGTVTSDAFAGPLTGDVTGNASGTSATVTGAAQTAITSLGTLTALQTDNINVNGNTISSTAGTDLNITPLAGQQIVLDGAIVVDAGVVTGATSITSTAFVGDVTGNVSGTSATVTGAAQTAITSLGTLTALQIDNINVDLNTISSTAGTDLNITPLAGQQIVLDGAIVVDAGVVTGATSITSTAFVGDVTGNVSGTSATVTGAAQTAITSLGSLTGLDVNGATTINDNLSLDGSNKELRFYEGSNYVGFEAPALSADKIWVLPAADGSADQVLKTDGSGNLDWVADGGSSTIDGLSDAKYGGTNFTGSMIIGHETTGTLNAATYNTAVGIAALDAITTGDYNVAVGDHALSANNTGYVNTAIGAYALSANTEGYANTAIGEEALELNQSGDWNTAIGVQALEANVSGSGNTAIGEEALQANTASYNTAIGLQALEANVSGAGNTAIGSEALQANTASYNTAIGTEALTANTTGTRNIAIGYAAYDAADEEDDNLAIGYNALGGSIDGGEDNVAVGNYTLSTLTTGDYNTAIGKDALKMATTGYSNTATGDRSLSSVTTGYHNTAMGSLSGYGITEGYSNVSVGYGANQNTTTGSYNVAIGQSALIYNQTGNSNTAIGKGALEGASGQSLGGNTALGYDAGNDITTGDYNVFLGYQAGDAITTGDNNIIIGRNADPSANNATNQIVIGYGATGIVDNSVTLGNTSNESVFISSTASTKPLVEIKNTTIDGNSGILKFAKDKGVAGADGDDIGVIEFIGDDAGQTQTSFAKIVAEVSEADNTDEAGKLSLYVAESDGTNTALTAGLVLEGEHATNGEVDVTIGAGTSSLTAVAGTLSVGGAFTIPASIGSSGQVLKAPSSGTVLEWGTGFAGAINDLSDAKLAGANFTGGLSIGHAMTAATLATATYNTAIGVTALDALTEGDYNTAIGEDALTSLTTGQWNTAVGYKAGKDGASLFRNTFIGFEAGAYGGSNYNVGVGYRALKSASGEFNTGVGMESLSGSSGASNTGVGAYSLADGSLSGSSNTAVGSSSLRNNEGGANNTAVGLEAAKDNTSGNENVAIGSNSLSANLTGNRNIAIGYQALDAADAEHDNLAIGHGALGGAIVANGEFNIAIGNYTLDANTSGTNNVAVGYNALTANTTGLRNIAIGVGALDAADDETDNIAIGHDALGGAVAAGAYNVAIGSYTLGGVTSAIANVAIGYKALQTNASSNSNTAIGYYASNLTRGAWNTSLGTLALQTNDGGTYNTALGNQTLQYLTSGTHNIAVGHAAGDNITTGSANTLLGWGADTSVNNVNYETVIGYAAVGNGTNTVTLGNSSVTAIHAQVQSISALSDVRAKREINDGKLGLDFINKLRTVTYKLKNPADYPEEILERNFKEEIIERPKDNETVHNGLIAQEIKKVMDELGIQWSGWSQNESNGKQGIQYGALTVPLIKAVQEQQEMIDFLKKTIEDQNKRFEKIESLLLKKG